MRQYCVANLHEKLKGRPDLIDKLTPDYPVFGKRIVMDVDWLSTLRRDNVSLENTPIDHVEKDAIILKDGQRIAVDVIVCATGFEIAKMTGRMTIRASAMRQGSARAWTAMPAAICR